jgi:hypothetical protein
MGAAAEPALETVIISRQISPRLNNIMSPGLNATLFTLEIVFHGCNSLVPGLASNPLVASTKYRVMPPS